VALSGDPESTTWVVTILYPQAGLVEAHFLRLTLARAWFYHWSEHLSMSDLSRSDSTLCSAQHPRLKLQPL